VEETLPWHTLSASGTAVVAEPWTVETRRCADGRPDEFFSTLPRGERVTGIHRSSEFVLPETLSFYVAGHCGFPTGDCHGRNLVRLLDAETGQIIAEAVAPRNDIAQEVVWDLGTHAGGRGYLELIDGDGATAYAWLAVGRFSLDRLNPQGFSPLDAAVELTAQYRLTELTPELRGLLRDGSAAMPRRTTAARALVALDQDARLRALVSFAANARVEERIQSEILAAVDTRDAASIDETLAALVQSLSASEQEACAKILCSDRAGGEALFKLIEGGKASRWLLLDETLKRQLAATRVADVGRRLNELTRGLPSIDERIAGQIADHRRSFNVETASPQRGREVFEKHCAACHRIGEKGSLIAPQLDGVGLRGIDRLLEDILDPNRNVDAAFQTTTVVTDDGAVLTGLFRRKDGETLVFADQKGQEVSVPAAEIEEQATSPVSLMPANFTDLATPEQIDDLLAFLLEQRTPVDPK
jgi:putative heme-binding domain-containing protein